MAEPRTLLKIAAVLLVVTSLTDARMEIITSAQDVKMGYDQLLFCKAGAEGDITWRKDGEDIEDFDEFLVEKVDETSSKLTIKKATLHKAGRYSCFCEFHSGHTDETYVQIYVYEGPVFMNMPTYHEFLVGQEAVIPCSVKGQPEVDVNWHPVPSDGRVRQDNSLIITDIQSKHRGTYVCEATIRGRPISNRESISVVINVPPTVTIHEREKSVVAGQRNVTLICRVSGFPQPTISWISPPSSNASRYVFNSDKSELIIPSVVRSDFGEYICTGTNKIGENSSAIILDVSEHPTLTLSKDMMQVVPGEKTSVSCEGSGHPPPRIQWVKSSNHEVTSSRVVAEGPLLELKNIAPSDGGLYTCMALNSAGNSTKNFSLQTWPDVPMQINVTGGPTSAHISLDAPVVDGGSPISQYIVEWRKGGEDSWTQSVIQATEPLVITSLKPYTFYSVRLAAKNHVGQGGFSPVHRVRTLAKREPDSPLLQQSEGQVEKNSFLIPIKQVDDGGSPITHYTVRYRPDKEGRDWQDMKLPSNASEIHLSNLEGSTTYQLEVVAFNRNGSSSPAILNFSMPVVQQQKVGLGKGGVVGIVMLIFLVLLIAVDATCCYTNHCGLLMFLAVKLLGQKVPGSKGLEEGDGDISTIDMKLKGLAAQRGSIPKQQQQNGVQPEVTCDKAPLTKFEKPPANSDPSTEA